MTAAKPQVCKGQQGQLISFYSVLVHNLVVLAVFT